MLIQLEELKKYLKFPVKGVIHIGAHLCEEQEVYDKLNIPNENILWIDALPLKPNVYKACIYSEDNEFKNFYISNNIQSSSLLEFNEHKNLYPWVETQATIQVETKKLSTVIRELGLDMLKYNFLNIDVQGSEHDVLMSIVDHLTYIDYIYLEVNEKDIYKDCVKFETIKNFLNFYRFDLVWCDYDYLEKNGWSDALFVRRKKTYGEKFILHNMEIPNFTE